MSRIRALVYMTLGLAFVPSIGCKDKEAERRIAELERKLQENEDEQKTKESDPKTPSKANFEKVIRNEMSNSRHVLIQSRGGLGNAGRKCEFREFVEAMKAVGIVGYIDKAQPKRGFGVMPDWRVFFEPQGTQSVYEDDLAVVLGYPDPNSIEVVRFSEPTAAMGRTVAEVEYTFQWRLAETFSIGDERSKVFQKAMEEGGVLSLDVSQRENEKVIFVLYSDGWKGEIKPQRYEQK